MMKDGREHAMTFIRPEKTDGTVGVPRFGIESTVLEGNNPVNPSLNHSFFDFRPIS